MEPSPEGGVQDAIEVIRAATTVFEIHKEEFEKAKAELEAARGVLLGLADKYPHFFLSPLSFDDGLLGKVSVSVYPITKVRYNSSLAAFLINRGLGHVVKIEQKVDDDLLMEEVRKGTVGLEEIRSMSDVGRTYGVRVKRTEPVSE